MATKPITARVDLYSVRFWQAKGNRTFEFVLLEQTDSPPPSSRTSKEVCWKEYGSITLAIIPNTGDLKGERFVLERPCAFTETHEYGKGKEQKGRRKFVVTTSVDLDTAQLERLYLGQANGWEMVLVPVAKTKELDLDKHPAETSTEAITGPGAPKAKRSRKAKAE